MGDQKEWKPNPTIREKVLNEIIQTEMDYVKDLQLIINVYKKDLISRGIITAEQERTLFSNVEELEELNRCDVLAKFEARFKAVQETGAPLAIVNLGDIFLQLSDQLKWYTEYCANQPQALAMLDSLNTENKMFQDYHAMMMNEKKEFSRGLSLLSFLIKPVQRLMKYPLLLRELIGLTDPTTQEYERLVDAAKKVGETVEFVNAMQREAELKAAKKASEIEDIEKSIDGAEALQLSQDKNLSITRVGFVQIFHSKKKKLVPRKVFLFNNLILIVKRNESMMKKKNAREFSLECSFYISNLVFSDISNIADVKYGFELKNKEPSANAFQSTERSQQTAQVTVLISCETLDIKNEWLKDIKVLVKDHQVAEAKRRAVAQGINIPTKPANDLLSSVRPMSRSGSISMGGHSPVMPMSPHTSSGGGLRSAQRDVGQPMHLSSGGANPNSPSALSSSPSNSAFHSSSGSASGSHASLSPMQNKMSNRMSETRPFPKARKTNSQSKMISNADLSSFARYPDPPPDDGRTDWKQLQDEIDNQPIEPIGFVCPPRWGQWVEYHSADFGIPYYYNIQTRVSTWSRPSGWTNFDPQGSFGRK